MTITVELLAEEALPLLRNLERLHVLQVVSPEKKEAEKTGATNGKVPIHNGGKFTGRTGERNEIASTIKPLRKNITLDELLAEQNFKGFDRQELDKLISEINIQEPIEELLEMLKS